MIIQFGFEAYYFNGLISKQPKSNIMRNLFFIVAGAMFLFVSCQSDDLPIYEASKMENAKKLPKKIILMSYDGMISIDSNDDFLQMGNGFASYIGEFTFVNTSNVSEPADFPVFFEGTITTANGDEIYYDSPVIVCDVANPAPTFCPGESATFTYTITGGTGRFVNAKGTLFTEGIFVPAGPFEAKGWAEFTSREIR